MRAIERPVVGDGEVLIAVRAAGGPDVMHVMTGKPYFARTMLGLTKPKQTTAGGDVAGTVVAVSDGVEGFAVGDEVYGAATSGSFAEYAVAPVTQLAHKPAALLVRRGRRRTRLGRHRPAGAAEGRRRRVRACW